jgi:hypothetical protein
MKTYLTEDEFVEIFWQEMNRKMSTDYSAATGDKIAWNLFQEFEKDVKDTLAGSMYGIEDFDGDNASELIGYQFHKSFRQTDPIDARYLNGIVWTCLQDAPVFWKCMDKACKILANKNLAEHYKELSEV